MLADPSWSGERFLSKKSDGRQSFTSMVDIVKAFWEGMNADEVLVRGSQLPALNVEYGEGDEPVPTTAATASSSRSMGVGLQSTSLVKNEIDDRHFADLGFEVGVHVAIATDSTTVYTITAIEGQTVELTNAKSDSKKSMTRCEAADNCKIQHVDKLKDSLFVFVMPPGLSGRVGWAVAGSARRGVV